MLSVRRDRLESQGVELPEPGVAAEGGVGQVLLCLGIEVPAAALETVRRCPLGKRVGPAA